MTPLVLAWTVIVTLAVLVGYLVVALVVMTVRWCGAGCHRRVTTPKAPPVGEVPQWTSLDDQQVARYLKQSPP